MKQKADVSIGTENETPHPTYEEEKKDIYRHILRQTNFLSDISSIVG